MSQVLITGGAGFIGTNLASRYLKKGHEVAIFDNFSRHGSKFNLQWLKQNHPQIEVVEGDIRKEKELSKFFERKADLVFHLAAQVAVTTSVSNPKEDFEINARGTLNVLEAVRKSNSDPVFIFSSTNKVYGGMEGIEFVEREQDYQYKDFSNGISENFNLDFHSPYGCSKGSADQYTRDYARIYGMKTLVFRKSCIYGHNQFGIEDQGWIAWFISRIVLNKKITIYGDGKQVRDILFVDDLCDAYESASENINKTKGQVYNIGGGVQNQVSLLKALDIIKNALDIQANLTYQEARPGDQKVYISDIGKAKKDFDWEPKTDVNSGIKKLCEWITKNKEKFPN